MTNPALPTDEPLAQALHHAFGERARCVELIDMVGDASTRRYQRLALSDAPVATAIAMRLPPDALSRSDEAAASAVASELAFANVQRAAESRRIRVPRIYADLTARGNYTVLLEDLGDETLFVRLQTAPRESWLRWYERAVDLLCDWQQAFAAPASDCIAYTKRFDRALLRWELDHFREWGLEAYRGAVSPALRSALDTEFDALADAVCALPTTLVHRDWQSKNLMVLANDTLAVIDFQDALVGPKPYDLVALLCDSYVPLTEQEQRAGVARYLDRVHVTDAPAREAFVRAFHTQTLQRKLKDAGRFVFIDRVRKNPSFLQYIPQSVRYVRRALGASPERARLRSLLADAAPDWFGDDAPA